MEIKNRFVELFLELNKKSNGILGFTISQVYGLTPSDVIEFIMEYQKKGFITCDDEYRIKVTDAGRAAIESLYEKGITSKYTHGSDYFENMSIESRIKINEPYLPTTDFLISGKKKCFKGGENEGN